jgi:hypothetical protein
MPALAPPIVHAVDRALAFQIADRWPNATAMQDALRSAYEIVEQRPLPGVQRDSRESGIEDLSSGWEPESVAPITTSAIDFAVSVVFEPDATNDSIVVDFEDPTGKQERYEIRRKSERNLPAVQPEAVDDLSDISIVELPDK